MPERKRLFIITGPNGAGKTTLTRMFLKRFYCYPAKVYKNHKWPALKDNQKDPPVLLIGRDYDTKDVIVGADNYRGERFAKVVRHAVENSSFQTIILEAQKAGYGKRYFQLRDIGCEMFYVVVKCDPWDCWERLKKRGYYSIGADTIMYRTMITRYWHDTYPEDHRLMIHNDPTKGPPYKALEEGLEKLRKMVFQR